MSVLAAYVTNYISSCSRGLARFIIIETVAPGFVIFYCSSQLVSRLSIYKAPEVKITTSADFVGFVGQELYRKVGQAREYSSTCRRGKVTKSSLGVYEAIEGRYLIKATDNLVNNILFGICSFELDDTLLGYKNFCNISLNYIKLRDIGSFDTDSRQFQYSVIC